MGQCIFMGLIAYTWCEFNQGRIHYSLNRKLLDNDLSTFTITVTKLHEIISGTWIKSELVLAGIFISFALRLNMVTVMVHVATAHTLRPHYNPTYGTIVYSL